MPYFEGLRFDPRHLERASPDLALAVARAIRGDAISAAARSELEALSADLAARLTDRRRWCRTPEAWALRQLVEWKIAARHWSPSITMEVQRVLSGVDRSLERRQVTRPGFRVEYQMGAGCTSEPDVTPLEIVEPGSDPPVVRDTLPPDGQPVLVRRVVYWLQTALRIYTTLPFRMTAPAQTIVVSIDCSTGATMSGFAAYGNIYLFVAPDCAADFLCSLASHELFHLFQYDAGGWPTQSWASLFEGGAVWVEDAVAGGLNRYLHDAGDDIERGVLVEPNQSLDRCEYKSALLWRYIAEQAAPTAGAPFAGSGAYLELLRRCASETAIEAVIRQLFPGRVFARFLRVPGDDELISTDALFGNYALACRLKDLGPAASDARFDFAESRAPIRYPPGEPVRALARLAPLTAVLAPGAASIRFDGLDVEAWAHRFFDIAVEPGVVSAMIRCETTGGGAPLIEVAVIDEEGGVADILRSDKAPFVRWVSIERPGRLRISSLALVVSGTDTGSRFRLEIASAPASPDVLVTRWNAAVATEYEVDPRAAPWTWTSPDLHIQAPDGTATRAVVPGSANLLSIRLHNRGAAPAAGIAVDVEFQSSRIENGVPVVLAGAWRQALTAPGVPARLDDLALDPGQSRSWTVGWDPGINWTPGPDGDGERQLCVRAVLSVPGDHNADNKRALSMFVIAVPS